MPGSRLDRVDGPSDDGDGRISPNGFFLNKEWDKVSAFDISTGSTRYMKILLSLAVMMASLNAALAMAAGTPAVDAVAATRIANQNACMGCHQVARKVVGPSFQQIATMYQGDPAGEVKLVQKIKHGGSGVWGVIPMPGHLSMSDADLKTVSQWILAGAPK
jgi:cytochrome c